MKDFFSITLILFFVIDALGSIPNYFSVVQSFTKKERLLITIRELFIALLIMLSFHYLGALLLAWLHISKTTVEVSGGVVLFLIAIDLIFQKDEEMPVWGTKKPFIVPIATPIFAGPSVLAAIMIFSQRNLTNELPVLLAIFVSWFLSGILFCLASPIYRLIKEKGLMACQRLTGLIVAFIAVQLFLEGIKEIFNK